MLVTGKDFPERQFEMHPIVKMVQAKIPIFTIQKYFREIKQVLKVGMAYVLAIVS